MLQICKRKIMRNLIDVFVMCKVYNVSFGSGGTPGCAEKEVGQMSR